MTQRRTSLQTWGTDEQERSWWRRGRDPIGRHTMVATVMGVLLAALIGATLDPFNLRTSDDLRRAEEAAYAKAYVAVENQGYADGLPHGEVERLGERIVIAGEGADTPYGEQFAVGWTQGWNDALEAMRQEAIEVGLPEDYTEFRVLEAMSRR
ncbi:MAG: hypothetical protein OXH13_00660 [Chloroflexi bacterium]|nr:hypothetical protein [Chloroflexota bacterium]MCY3697146.1 hypothetical protein [Chloroflexota bacterium]MXX81401.1 hypothetical protein [Chloroflexota bacterium]MYF22903.1 hypothetical protein [Chloroflexota bacterium]